MLHNHVDVVGRDACLVFGSLARGGSLLLVLLGGGTGNLTTSSSLGGLSGGHSLDFSSSHALVGVVVLEFTEAYELVSIVAGDEHLGVVDHKDETISLLDSNAGNSSKLLHAELGKGFATLLLTSVKLGTILVLKSGHLFMIVRVGVVVVVGLRFLS